MIFLSMLLMDIFELFTGAFSKKKVNEKPNTNHLQFKFQFPFSVQS